MWELLVELLKAGLKKVTFKSIKRRAAKKVTSPFKFAKTLFTDPKKVIKRRGMKPIRRAKSTIRKATRLGRFGRLLLSPKARLIEKTTKNAMLLTALVDEENVMTAGKIASERTTSETAKMITQTKGVLNGRKTDEINEINNVILKELAGIGLDSQEKIARVIENEEFREQIIQASGFDTYMSHWKDGFFGYAAEQQGLSEAEADIIWEQIVHDHTFEKWVEKKGL